LTRSEAWAQLPGYKNARIERLLKKRRARQQQYDHPDAERIAQRVAGIALLVELAPGLLNYDAPVPLAIGIDRQLIELGMSVETVTDVLRWWTRQPAYRAAVAAGRKRQNLDGSIYHGNVMEQPNIHRQTGRNATARLRQQTHRERPACLVIGSWTTRLSRHSC
jgi:hypothetical protein